MKKAPSYKITIDPAYSGGEDLGIEQIAFTATPAIKVKGMAFSSSIQKSFFADAVKMRIAAPALIPMNIYRNDEDGEYYVEFTVEEIEALASKFMANLNNTGKFNLEHNDANTVPAYVLETWIVDEPLKDKAYSTYGIEVPKGTLMVVSQLTDKTYYDSLVANGQVGYSIEGFLGLKLSEIINKNKINNTMEYKMPENSKFSINGKTYTVLAGGAIKEDLDEEMAAAAPGLAVEPAAKAAPAVDDKKGAPVAPKEELAVPAPDAPVAEGDAATTTPTADVTTETPASAPADEQAILAVLQPKLDEVYKMIADLKAAIAQDAAEDEADDTDEDATATQMSIHDKFREVMKFVSND